MRRLLLIPVLTLMALFFVATPANAATIDSFEVTDSDGASVDGATVPVGTTIDIAYSATIAADGTVSRENTGDVSLAGFDDADADASFTLSGQVLSEVGTYEFTITATDAAGTAVEAISVEVTDATTEIEPGSITFPDPCTLVLEEQDNVEYGVGFGQSGSTLPADTYDLADFYFYGDPVTFAMVPAAGFSFPEGTETTFEVVVSEDCFPELVEATAICQGVTFTNTTDGTLAVQYGDIEEARVQGEPDGEFELAAGASRTVETDRDLVFYLGADDLDAGVFDQAGTVEVEQDCTPASAGAAYPTVAPAAGLS